jgi:hypothetical protein
MALDNSVEILIPNDEKLPPQNLRNDFGTSKNKANDNKQELIGSCLLFIL